MVELLIGYRHSLGCRVQKRYARARARKSQFLAATAILSTRYIQCNDIVRAFLR